MPTCSYCRQGITPGEGRIVQGATFCSTDHYALWVAAERRTR